MVKCSAHPKQNGTTGRPHGSTGRPSVWHDRPLLVARQAPTGGTTGPNMARQATITARKATTVAAAYNAAPLQPNEVQPR